MLRFMLNVEIYEKERSCYGKTVIGNVSSCVGIESPFKSSQAKTTTVSSATSGGKLLMFWVNHLPAATFPLAASPCTIKRSCPLARSR